ncbi:hypothetical protein CHH27_10065 [Labrenzia sp. VG12]|nr:hypothetical protein CHH27_10065 [Labrenzia sp. VG12]
MHENSALLKAIFRERALPEQGRGHGQASWGDERRAEINNSDKVQGGSASETLSGRKAEGRAEAKAPMRDVFDRQPESSERHGAKWRVSDVFRSTGR